MEETRTPTPAAPAPDSGCESWRATFAAPEVELEPFTPAELHVWFRGGERQADECEKVLAWAARARGALDVAIAEGLHALRKGDRLAQLGFHLDDYGREVLDLAESATRKLARLGAELRDRPLLREALRSGRVGLRAAETVLPVALREAEAVWVERAAHCTVRELEEAVRRVKAGEDADDDWFRLRTYLPGEERELFDTALEVAGAIGESSSRLDRLEAMAQECLGELARHDYGEDELPIGSGFRAIGPGDGARRAERERETERWCVLPAVAGIAAPDVGIDELATAREVDARVRELAKLRESWERLIGWCACAVKRSGLAALLGFASFGQYVEERLGLPRRAVEQRAELEKRVWASPALQEARRQKLSYEKVRVLSRLPERDIAAWTPRAHALTCIELRRRVEGERVRQMRVARTLVVSVPRRVAVLLAAAVNAVRKHVGRKLPLGKCLSLVASHFVDTWGSSVKPARTRAQKVLERDEGNCQVPGCSHRAEHAHHVQYRSRGGGDELANQVAACAFHHLRCIHGGFLQVTGQAPDALTWRLPTGEEFTGTAGAHGGA